MKKNLKTSLSLYSEMTDRVHGCTLRMRSAEEAGNRAAMLAESRALLGQVRSLVELLEGDLAREGKAAGRKEIK